MHVERDGRLRIALPEAGELLARVPEPFAVLFCGVTARDEPGEWHHHAGCDGVVYLISGRCRIDHGGTSTLMSAGDVGLLGRGVIRRMQILDDGRCHYTLFRPGHGESVGVINGPSLRAAA